jgi:hypothetical protein
MQDTPNPKVEKQQFPKVQLIPEIIERPLPTQTTNQPQPARRENVNLGDSVIDVFVVDE